MLKNQCPNFCSFVVEAGLQMPPDIDSTSLVILISARSSKGGGMGRHPNLWQIKKDQWEGWSPRWSGHEY